ncbi:uncharacterized mitochondrial protein AtMg00810-like [Beta vulgaris subsp. vulgaris]|uniref:uncharacterized mitochondrial protein AtMg00810-like n=1 Tax=Beta vulgaris subsp. vulgaris TaxID=3555 RepID=UPI00090051D0|nr:uncharacterized mitochondrial protein AtMg00810-like [Beta vulgaris subsp. vulgaris]
MTRLDIAYDVNIASQFIHAPRTTDLHGVKRIFRYQQDTLTFGLFLHSSSAPTAVIAYSDEDWVVCPNTRHSIIGYDVFLGKNLISWSSKKQPIVSKFSTERS